MEYDNERDRTLYGYDAGNIIDGEVVFDSDTKEYIVIDEDHRAFSTQALLKSLLGKKVRLTCISLEAIEAIEKMVVSTG